MSLDNYLDAFGYAPIAVIMKGGAAAKAKKPSKKIENKFVSSVPRGIGTSLSMRQKDQTYTYFSNLGIYYGYMDKRGVKSAQDTDEVTIHLPQIPSLIRPVYRRLAMSADRMTWGLETLAVEDLWNQGLTGKGVKVAHADTGVDAKHEALRGKIKGWIDTDPQSGEIIPDGRSPENAAYDDDEHGTHTAGTICGGLANGMAIGVAPNANLYCAKVIEGGQVVARILNAFEWFIENGCRVLSMSLGLRGYDRFWEDVINRLRQNGIIPCIAAGNEGENTIRSPGGSIGAITIGAIDSNQHVAEFSSSIIFDRREEPNEPECVAPGVDVISAKPGGGVQSMAGTSMATPHFAGTAAILLQAYPNATVAQVEQALQSTCKHLDPPERKERYGYGLEVPLKALEALKKISQR
jgi:subtilisin family serine protease